MEQRYLARFVGRTEPVLCEEQRDGLWWGHTTRYSEVAVESGDGLHNQIREVRLTGVEGATLRGTLFSPAGGAAEETVV